MSKKTTATESNVLNQSPVSAEQSIKIFEKESTPFINKAQKVEITTSKDMEVAAEVLSNINRYADQVKDKKESITKPINTALKNIRSLFAPLEDRLSEAKLMIRNEMTRYQTEETKRAKEEEAKIAARIGSGKGKIGIETAVKKMEEIEKPDQVVTASSGSVKFRTVKNFEVMDITMLPTEYILPDEVKIRNAMKAGMELKGVRYYEEQIPVNSR